METVIIELRNGEGGLDSKLLVKDLADAYKKAARIENFSLSVVDEREGYISLCL